MKNEDNEGRQTDDRLHGVKIRGILKRKEAGPKQSLKAIAVFTTIWGAKPKVGVCRTKATGTAVKKAKFQLTWWDFGGKS